MNTNKRLSMVFQNIPEIQPPGKFGINSNKKMNFQNFILPLLSEQSVDYQRAMLLWKRFPLSMDQTSYFQLTAHTSQCANHSTL